MKIITRIIFLPPLRKVEPKSTFKKGGAKTSTFKENHHNLIHWSQMQMECLNFDSGKGFGELRSLTGQSSSTISLTNSSKEMRGFHPKSL